ncbi:IS66 family transposase [Vibrio crassostreae]|jgi:IS1 family transposase|uniref:IS66 family transposase n=1 Tax=Vibrio crassostreae TaxID=246167 RepID=UPI001FF029BC|nr:transposase [Vibrio crassostreae]
MAHETSHQRNNDKRWVWATLSNDVDFFQINSSRGQHAAKRLLGEAVSHLLMTDQYSAYKYIDESKRQLSVSGSHTKECHSYRGEHLS